MPLKTRLVFQEDDIDVIGAISVINARPPATPVHICADFANGAEILTVTAFRLMY
jgi:hypothetical protein